MHNTKLWKNMCSIQDQSKTKTGVLWRTADICKDSKNPWSIVVWLVGEEPDCHGTDLRWQSIDHQMTKYRSPESRVQIVRWLGTDHQMTKYRSLESRVQITREADEEPELLRLAQGRVQKKINHPSYIKKHTQKYPEISENFWSMSLRANNFNDNSAATTTLRTHAHN